MMKTMIYLSLATMIGLIWVAGCELDSGLDEPDVTCGPTSDPFPLLERSCTDQADCDVGLHQIDCCGTLQAIGINISSRTAFDHVEQACRAEFPACGCAPQGIQTDDGLGFDLTQVDVACDIGICRTFAVQ